MSRRLRLAVTILAVLAFLVTAPIVVLRTIGYRLDIKKGKVSQTGVLVVDSTPSGAAVIIDGRPTGEVTPTRIRDLPPKRYEVRLEAPGRHPWKKTLDVQSSGVTFAEDVVLFPTRSATVLVGGPIRSASMSPDGSWMAYILSGDRNEVRVRNLESDQDGLILDLPAETTPEFEWAPKGDRLLVIRRTDVGIKATSAVLPLGNPRLDLEEILEKLPSSIHWSTDEPGQIEAVVGRLLVRIDPVAGRSVTLAQIDGKEARMHRGKIYEIRPTLTAAVLSERAVDKPDAPRDIAILPSLSFRLGQPRASWLPLVDPDGEKILVVQTGGVAAEPLNLSAANLAWFPDDSSREFLFWNPFELWTADPLSETTTLITRLGTELDDAAWNHDGTNLYIVSRGKLEALERDDRGGRNTVTLAEFSAINDIMPSPDGKFLFFIGTENDETGIYQLDLRQ